MTIMVINAILFWPCYREETSAHCFQFDFRLTPAEIQNLWISAEIKILFYPFLQNKNKQNPSLG